MEKSLEQFAAQCGIDFEQYGLPNAAGQIFGFLLVCTPAIQSSSALAETLQLSKPTISVATRLLEQVGFIQQVAYPERRGPHWFRIAEGAPTAVLRHHLGEIEQLLSVFEKGLQMAGPEHTAQRECMVGLRGHYDILRLLLRGTLTQLESAVGEQVVD